ncbi:MAG TPA: Ig-like domain-containing protein [Fibrobacteria bacterium]|nr:Ig-like domain-containing protein [Fibrobacteria bacterium]
MKKCTVFLLAFLACAALFLLACTESEEGRKILRITIDKENDSLLTFDSLIVTVHSKDGSFSHDAFHGILRSPEQVAYLVLDPRVGDDYSVTIVGYKNGKVGVHKEITFINKISQSRDVPIKPDTVVAPDTVVTPGSPEILAPSDTSIAEGDSLRFRVSVRNPWSNPTTLTLKDAIPGAALDTVGRDPGDGYFTWRPNFDQGRSEPYAVTFVYSAAADKKVAKIIRVKVLNVNRPPKLAPILDQAVKENETLTFKVEAMDPDLDSLSFTSSALPQGAAFSSDAFTWKPTTGQAGNYAVKFKVWDGKDSDLVAVHITVGNVEVAPAVALVITSPTQDTTVNVTSITILYTVNGVSRQKNLPLKEGKNKIFIDTTIAGRTGLDTVTVTLDTVPPGKPTVNGATLVNTRTPTWTWKSGGGGIAAYRYRLDIEDMSASTLSTDTSYTASKDLDPGTHTLYVQERDAVGNWSQSGRRVIRIDTVRPAPPKVTISPASPTRNVQPTWNWTGSGDDAVGLFRYKLDNGDLRSGATETRALNYTPDPAHVLNEGPHWLYVQQQDSAGNWSNADSVFIRIDVTPPRAPVFLPLPLSPLNSLKPTWTWMSGGEGGNGTYRCKLDDAGLESGAISVGNGQYTPAGNLSEGPHTLYVEEGDSAGNWSKATSKTLVLALSGVVGKSGFSTGEAWAVSLALDTQGVPYVAFTDNAYGEKATVMRWNGLAWENVGNPGFTPGTVGYFISLAFGAEGAPYIAFTDGANGKKASVMRWNGTIWENVGKAGFSPDVADFTSLAFSRTGVPYVAFRDSSQGGKATVMRFNGMAWETEGAAGFSEGFANFLSLKLNSIGTPYVAFKDYAHGGKATVMRFNGTWENVGNAGFSSGEADYSSLTLDSRGLPYIAFTDVPIGGKATVMRFNGTKWENIGNAGFSEGRAHFPSLKIDGMGMPYVAFADGAYDGKATIKRWSGSSWENVGDPGFSVGSIGSPSLVLNDLGVPYLAFLDAATGYKVIVMKVSFKP